MTAYRFVLCDVFTRRPLAGNALAVFTDARGMADETMQAVARETNLSETTFVLPARSAGSLRVRIFTPARELPFAGHPLIGTAAVAGRSVPLERLVLETGVGPIAVELEREGAEVVGATMEQPEPAFSDLAEGQARELAAALGLDPRAAVVADNGLHTAIVAADSLEQLSSLGPDARRLGRLRGFDTCAVYAPPPDEGEVRVRVFAPGAGVAEDPGTGSAAGPLAEHLVRRGLRPAGQVSILQGVEIGRPSRIEVVAGLGPPRVGGAVAFVARGSFSL
jgi:trans-2,3-dihydro-3-hydroxyanthranilate isomerase